MKYALTSTHATITRAAAESSSGQATGADRTAEFVTFRLKDGISNADFVQAASAIGAYLRNSGNVISRSLSRDDDGLWTDHIVWISMSSAKATATEVMQQPAFGKMADMIDPDSMNLRYGAILMQMD